MREIDSQDAEEARPAGFGAFQLVVPVVRAGEEAMHHADDADAAPARFDGPLVRDGRRATPALALRGKPPRRIPGRHDGTGLHARAEVQRHRDGLPVALLERRRHEPGRNTRPGGDGLPDFLRRAGDLDFDLDGTASGGVFLHAHDGSLGSDVCGRGCATTTRRCARPPGADASWYFATSVVMASVSSVLNAARSVADRKRTSVSTARVARRLPVSVRTTHKVAHLANDACAQGDEIARGQPVDSPIRIRGDRAQGARRHDVGRGRRHEQPFRQPAPLAFLGQPHQPVRLQRVQVVVDFLPGQADPRGQRRRRGGHDQLGEESTPHGLQRHRRRGRIIDDLDVEHEAMVVLTTFIVNNEFKAISDEFAESMSCRRIVCCGEVSSSARGDDDRHARREESEIRRELGIQTVTSRKLMAGERNGPHRPRSFSRSWARPVRVVLVQPDKLRFEDQRELVRVAVADGCGR